MYKTIIMNAKGGCGKTTIATNLASYYASHGYSTALLDYDPQGSSANWLKRRDDSFSAIQSVDTCQKSGMVTRSWLMRLAPDVERVIIDTPAAVKAYDAAAYLKGVRTIVVPVLATVIDVEASACFVSELLKVPQVRSGQVNVFVVANRVRSRSPALSILHDVFSDMGVPVVAQLKETAAYVQGTDLGIGVHELPANRAKIERATWAKLVEAIDPKFDEAHSASEGKPTIPTIHSISDKVLRDIPLSIPLAETGRYSVSWK